MYKTLLGPGDKLLAKLTWLLPLRDLTVISMKTVINPITHKCMTKKHGIPLPEGRVGRVSWVKLEGAACEWGHGGAKK